MSNKKNAVTDSEFANNLEKTLNLDQKLKQEIKDLGDVVGKECELDVTLDSCKKYGNVDYNADIIELPVRRVLSESLDNNKDDKGNSSWTSIFSNSLKSSDVRNLENKLSIIPYITLKKTNRSFGFTRTFPFIDIFYGECHVAVDKGKFYNHLYGANANKIDGDGVFNDSVVKGGLKDILNEKDRELKEQGPVLGCGTGIKDTFEELKVKFSTTKKMVFPM